MFSVSRFSVSVYVILVSLLFMAFLSSPARAEQTVAITECTEDEFRAAVAQAPSGTAINFGGDCEITLTEEKSPGTIGESGGPEAIAIDKELTIDGGVHNVTISGGGEVGIFYNKGDAEFANTTLTLKNLTLKNGAGRNFFVQNGQGFGGGASGGGAVYNEAKLVVEGVSFIGNQAFDAGGAIYSRGPFAHASVTDSTFIGNEAECGGLCATPGGGGAIAVAARGATEIENSVFRGNTAFGRGASGGAVLARRSVRVTETGPVSISGSTFEENKALTFSPSDQSRQGGGAVFVFNRVLTIAESTFDKNESNAVGRDKNPGGFNIQQYGGAIVVEGFGPTPESLRRTEISDSTFTGNSASGIASYGGALYVLRAPTSISNVTFTGNEAERTGAIDNSGAAVEITDSEIEDNTATGTKDEGPLTVGGVGTQSQGTELEPGVGTEATTTFARTKVSNNVNGNCATAPVGNIVDNGENSENPGTSCGFNGATRVEKSRPNTTDDEYEFDAGMTLSVPAPGVLENDSDPEGEAMGAELVGEPRRGAVVLDADGSFEYTPDAGTIADTFTYRVKSPDKLRQSRVATVKVGVASEIVVNTSEDGVDPEDNACTLREAAISAHLNTVSGGGPRECAAGSENDTITFDLPDDAEITLGGSDVEIPSAMSIDGSTVNGLTISGGEESRVFSVMDGSAEIKDLAITKGADKEPAGEGIGGGGIFNSNLADLTLTNVLVSGNTTATIGGGVRTLGDLTVKNSSITGNVAESDGGAIHNNFGSLTVEASTLSGNKSTDGLGGGIFSTTEDISEIEDPLSKSVVRNSTISGNTALSGGGVYNNNGLAVIENSTITENAVSEGGGSGVGSFGGDLTRTKVSSSIIAANQGTDADSGGDGANSFESLGHNLIGDGNATVGENNAFDETGDRSGVANPGLEPLADNGGPTETHALRAGSPALDKGNTSLDTDQRGEARPFDIPNIGNVGDGSDIGAFEAQSLPAPPGGGGGGDEPPNPNACTIVGTPGNDVLRGTPGRDVICGLGGNDVIRGMGGNDVLRGGAGDDRILGGTGNDTLVGGSGDDLVHGGPGNDRIFGGAGDDLLRGGAGNDALVGGEGRDLLRGEGGKDRLIARDGVRGNDVANGGPGRDSCGADRGDVKRSCP